MKTYRTVHFVNNPDSGSLMLEAEYLPEQFREHGLRPDPGTLSIRVNGGDVVNVTYIMGSVDNGFHLCCRGAGRFPDNGVVDILEAE